MMLSLATECIDVKEREMCYCRIITIGMSNKHSLGMKNRFQLKSWTRIDRSKDCSVRKHEEMKMSPI